MILYGSSISDGNAHTHDDLPLVLVGGAAGRSRAAGTSASRKETPMNNLLLTMLFKAGLHPSAKFGDSNGFHRTPLGRVAGRRSGELPRLDRRRMAGGVNPPLAAAS